MLSEDNNDNVLRDDDGSVYQPQGPLTFEKVWLMFQETDKKFQETERLMKEQSRETDKKFQETDRMFQETRKEVRETTRSVRSLSKNIGGIGNNLGEVAEEYFRGALKSMKEFAGVKIEFAGNLHKRLQNLEAEYDVVLFGKDTLIVIEAKHKLTRDDVLQFINKSLPAFKPLFPLYSNFRIIGAVAGMTAQKTAIEEAISKGLYVITQSGQKIRLLNPEGFEPKEY